MGRKLKSKRYVAQIREAINRENNRSRFSDAVKDSGAPPNVSAEKVGHFNHPFQAHEYHEMDTM